MNVCMYEYILVFMYVCLCITVHVRMYIYVCGLVQLQSSRRFLLDACVERRCIPATDQMLLVLVRQINTLNPHYEGSAAYIKRL